MLKNKLEKIAYRRLFKQLSLKSRSVNIYKLEEAKHIGIIWNQNDVNAANQIQKIIQQLKRPNCFIHTYSYTNNPININGSSVQNVVVTPKQIKWTGAPKSSEAIEFINTSFDVLIDLSIQHNLPITYALAMNNSRFKITSNCHHYEVADFFIQSPNKGILEIFTSMKEYIDKF
ncbi:hypothetical protein K5X82_05435 [Halosquirtibacter xylanolyticus]|uniref:DUF6913 domain-containing protein n=1 Tax=Halosquirtibacter xylanolyticus TaxID=3374599 RepID=UPI00374A37DB|nr:hypothetical protein K5X82_05435 [Prolixibacteraceae bacterium]